MKFKLLSVGQKFEFEGEVYVKTTPLIASNYKTGHNKMIPRYAALRLLDDNGLTDHKTTDKSLNSVDVFAAFNDFYQSCISTLEKNNILHPQIKDELDKARDKFTQHLI